MCELPAAASLGLSYVQIREKARKGDAKYVGISTGYATRIAKEVQDSYKCTRWRTAPDVRAGMPTQAQQDMEMQPRAPEASGRNAKDRKQNVVIARILGIALRSILRIPLDKVLLVEAYCEDDWTTTLSLPTINFFRVFNAKASLHAVGRIGHVASCLCALKQLAQLQLLCVQSRA